MAVETNARIEFSIASVEEWEKVNPKLHQGEPVFAKKPSGKYILKVGAPGGSTYKNAVVVWDQDDAETKMTSTQEAAAQALASKNVASASASAAKASENAAAASKSAAAKSEANAKTSETNAAASKASAANSASTASSNATASADSASAAATSEKNAASSASAANTSESNAMKSSNAANISADKAKVSETNAAKSATAAAQSAENAKLFDPTTYAKLRECFVITDTGRKIIETEGLTDLNDIKCVSYPSWLCRLTATIPKLSHCPTGTAFFLYNMRSGFSSDKETLPNLTGYYYYIVQLLVDINGDVWRRVAFNMSTSTFTFTDWKKLAITADIDTKITALKTDNLALWNYLHRFGENAVPPTVNSELNKLGVFSSFYTESDTIPNQPTEYGQLINLPADDGSESAQLWLSQNEANLYHRGGNFAHPISERPFKRFLDEDDATAIRDQIPTKTSQLTNDSDFANTAALEAEAKKWKAAYNNLRKHCVPAVFSGDDVELTSLLAAPMGQGTIHLSQPYTNFDGLLFDITGDNGEYVCSAYLSTAEFNRRIQVAKSVGANVIFLFEGRNYWTIYINSTFSTTSFTEEGDNCQIKHIYGVTLKTIT